MVGFIVTLVSAGLILSSSIVTAVGDPEVPPEYRAAEEAPYFERDSQRFAVVPSVVGDIALPAPAPAPDAWYTAQVDRYRGMEAVAAAANGVTGVHHADSGAAAWGADSGIAWGADSGAAWGSLPAPYSDYTVAQPTRVAPAAVPLIDDTPSVVWQLPPTWAK